jgi:hypothetical protein
MLAVATSIVAISAAVFGLQAQAQTMPMTPPAGMQPGEGAGTPPPASGGHSHRSSGHRHSDHRGMMSRIDLDKDGAVSRNELLAAQQKQLQAFDAADANRDGVLSREEMQAFQQQMRGQHRSGGPRS